MIFQDPYTSLNPRHTVGAIVGAPLRDPQRGAEEADPPAGPGAAGGRRAQPRALQPLPARVLRRPAPAHRHRPGARPCSPKLLVADEPVSALDVSIQAQVINLLQDLQQRVRHRVPLHRARPRRRPALLPRGRGDVPRQDRRDRATARRSTTGANHPYTQALLSAVPGRQAGGHRWPSRADPARGRRAEPDQPAVGLPVPHPLPARPGDLRPGRAAAAADRPAPQGRLPLRRASSATTRTSRSRPRCSASTHQGSPDPGASPSTDLGDEPGYADTWFDLERKTMAWPSA